MSPSGYSFRRLLSPRDANDEVGDRVAQVESVVEPVGEGSAVGLGVLEVLQRLEGIVEQPSGFLTRHGAVDFVVQQPSSGVAHAQVSREDQRRNAGFGLTDEVDGQKPSGQRQLSVFPQGANGQRGPKAAAAALVEFAGALPRKVLLRAGALRAANPCGHRERLSGSTHCASVPK